MLCLIVYGCKVYFSTVYLFIQPNILIVLATDLLNGRPFITYSIHTENIYLFIRHNIHHLFSVLTSIMSEFIFLLKSLFLRL